MSVRKVKEQDRNRLSELAVEYLEPLYGGQTHALRKWMDEDSHKKVWVYEDGKEVAGFIALSHKPEKDYVKISTLLVDKPYQQQGIGSKLYQTALNHAYDLDRPEISVTVDLGIEESWKFFCDRGFKLKKILDGEYKKDSKELVLARDLS